MYELAPTGDYENDPNATDKKFPGNPTRSYRSADPIRIVREVHDRTRLSQDTLQDWRSRIAAINADRGAIIN